MILKNDIRKTCSYTRMILYRELDKTAIIFKFEFLGKSFRNLEKLFLDRTSPSIRRKLFAGSNIIV